MGREHRRSGVIGQIVQVMTCSMCSCSLRAFLTPRKSIPSGGESRRIGVDSFEESPAAPQDQQRDDHTGKRVNGVPVCQPNH